MDFTSLGLLGLFLSSFLAATILPFSSEAIFIYFIYIGKHPFICLALVTTGNFIGGLTNYYLGYLGNPRWLKRIGMSEAKICKQEKWVTKYASLLGFFSWVPFVGDPLLVALGYYKSPISKTIFWMFVGKFLRYSVLLVIYLYWKK